MNTVRKYQGFSLIELMVVIAIVALLTAVAVPVYKDYIRNAKISTVMPVINGYMQGLWIPFMTNGTIKTLAEVGYNGSSHPVASLADYAVPPYLAFMYVNMVQATPTTCATLFTYSYVSNIDGPGLTNNQNFPYIVFEQFVYDVNGVTTQICGFYSYTSTGSHDLNTINGCYNLSNSSDLSAFSAAQSAINNQCAN